MVAYVGGSPCSPALTPQLLVGVGEEAGLTTGAKALLAFMLAEKANTPWAELQFDTAMVGLVATTETAKRKI